MLSGWQQKLPWESFEWQRRLPWGGTGCPHAGGQGGMSEWRRWSWDEAGPWRGLVPEWIPAERRGLVKRVTASASFLVKSALSE